MLADLRPLSLSRRMVVGGQVAVVLVLLAGAALLIHSFWRMHRVDLGFAARGGRVRGVLSAGAARDCRGADGCSQERLGRLPITPTFLGSWALALGDWS